MTKKLLETEYGFEFVGDRKIDHTDFFIPTLPQKPVEENKQEDF
ncbi:hypothetical protein J2128_000533 [Methanomicrobium sp. W14]|nr:hypothetical protein [Methanomicrobium sp. W14]MBP2132612.1 hypothetical protein [Methanomicrobium sp. W14]